MNKVIFIAHSFRNRKAIQEYLTKYSHLEFSYPSQDNNKDENHTLFKSADLVIGVLDWEGMTMPNKSIGTKMEIKSAYKDGRLLTGLFLEKNPTHVTTMNWSQLSNFINWDEVPDEEQYLEGDVNS